MKWLATAIVTITLILAMGISELLAQALTPVSDALMAANEAIVTAP